MKNEKYDEGYNSKFNDKWTEWKKIQATACKKANLQTFDALADFFFFNI